MRINDYTKLKPYDPLLYSPIKRPPEVGELAITLDHPRGYCVVVQAIQHGLASTYFLDDGDRNLITYDLSSLIPTGKTPEDLTTLFEPTPQSLDTALDKEREFPEGLLTKATKKAAKSKKSFDIANMSQEQRSQLEAVIKQLLKGEN